MDPSLEGRNQSLVICKPGGGQKLDPGYVDSWLHELDLGTPCRQEQKNKSL